MKLNPQLAAQGKLWYFDTSPISSHRYIWMRANADGAIQRWLKSDEALGAWGRFDSVYLAVSDEIPTWTPPTKPRKKAKPE